MRSLFRLGTVPRVLPAINTGLRCESAKHSEFLRQDRPYFQCRSCRYQCGPVSGTVFKSSKRPLPTWVPAMHLMTQAKNNVSALDLKRVLALFYPTAWLLELKIMRVMVNQEQWRQLTGWVEINNLADDAYRGGEVQGGKAGHGWPNNIPFVAAVQTTESGQLIYMCLSQRPLVKESVQTIVEQSLAASVNLLSNGLDCFKAVRMGILHKPHVTAAVRPAPSTRASLPSTWLWATSKRRCPAPITPSDSGSARIDIWAKCSTC